MLPTPNSSASNSQENIHVLNQHSQINRNLSSNQIKRLNHPKPSKKLQLTSYNDGVTNFQLPLSPPLSNVSTPVREVKFSNHKSAWYQSWIPPIDVKVVGLCLAWYLFSVISNNSTKMILSQFKYPITLTEVQFLLNIALCMVVIASLVKFPALTTLFPKGTLPNLEEVNYSVLNFAWPTKEKLATTLPMGGFQFIGHITSHKATSLIPVASVHTIKALSPITTVFIYRFLFKKKYSSVTYLTLIPLMLGIMLTCYKPHNKDINNSSYLTGLGYAFFSMIIFVSQNIYAKNKLTPNPSNLPSYKSEQQQKKFDKLTILFNCSVIGFVFTLPVYIVLEFTNTTFSLTQLDHPLITLMLINGLSHFLQSLMAFQILGLISPINYSIANIMKRIIIILFAFMLESSFTFRDTQSYGIVLTLVGLYCYDKWGAKNK